MTDKARTMYSYTRPIGLLGLIEELGLEVPLPAVRSSVVRGARKTVVGGDGVISELYPQSYKPDGLIGNLKFAMRYEPIDLGVLSALFKVLDPTLLEAWVQKEKTSIFVRRAWYLYELLTETKLDISDVPSTGYVDLLNPELHITGSRKLISRQRINDNLLGDKNYCPLIRRTETLKKAMSEELSEEAKRIASSVDSTILARAVHYLYTKETKSSFAIEGETVSASRTERFVAALQRAAEFNTSDKQAFVKLQYSIVDPRYVADDWRDVQNYVGETMSDFREHIHFVCPKPMDVEDLMSGWMRMVDRLNNSDVDAVCAAAAAAFGYVFIHPFEDGNGRIHRFLVHHILARTGFTPQGLLFPVSAVMLRDSAGYNQVLSSFSSFILPMIDYSLDRYGSLTVHNETANLYRYWDATRFAEYLYKCVAETIRIDLKEELGFLAVFDAAMKAVMETVDMPNRRASLLIRLILQNKGMLSKAKRSQFPELSDDEIKAIESAVQASSTKC